MVEQQAPSEQDGRCAICRHEFRTGTRRGVHVDHDHETRRVRGLLCGPCNTALGGLKDDPSRLAAAARYLGLND